MASTKLTQEEVLFLASLRRLVARGGSLPINLDSGLQPIADPRTPQPVQKSAVVEPLSGYWSGSLAFSRNFDGPYPVSPGSQTLLEANQLPGPPRGRGITLSRIDRELGNTGVNFNYAVYADIEFGIGANLQRIRCDWQNCIINVPGSIVRVNTVWAAMDGSFPYSVLSLDGTTVEIGGNLAASVSTDPLVSKGYNTLTEWYDWSTALFIPVPPYAIGFWMGIDPNTVFAPADVVEVYDVSINPGANVSPRIGTIATSQIQSNGLTQLTSLPASAAVLKVDSAGLTLSNLPKIVWAMEI